MRVFVAGVDGYLGWSLAQHLLARGHDGRWGGRVPPQTLGRRNGVMECDPGVPDARAAAALDEHFGTNFRFWEGDLTHYELVAQILEEFQPDAIVHLGECPSAPYSMIDAEHCAFVQRNNMVSTTNLVFAMEQFVPDAHLVKLGTMGEYGTPNVAIPEGLLRARVPRPHATGCRSRVRPAPGTTGARSTGRTTSCSPASCGDCGRRTSCRASCSARGSTDMADDDRAARPAWTSTRRSGPRSTASAAKR